MKTFAYAGYEMDTNGTDVLIITNILTEKPVLEQFTKLTTNIATEVETYSEQVSGDITGLKYGNGIHPGLYSGGVSREKNAAIDLAVSTSALYNFTEVSTPDSRGILSNAAYYESQIRLLKQFNTTGDISGPYTLPITRVDTARANLLMESNLWFFTETTIITSEKGAAWEQLFATTAPVDILDRIFIVHVTELGSSNSTFHISGYRYGSAQYNLPDPGVYRYLVEGIAVKPGTLEIINKKRVEVVRTNETTQTTSTDTSTASGGQLATGTAVAIRPSISSASLANRAQSITYSRTDTVNQVPNNVNTIGPRVE